MVLAQYGIEMDYIRDAYRHLNGRDNTILKRYENITSQQAIVTAVLERCRMSRRIGANFAGHGDEKARIVILGHLSNAEPRTTCEILREGLQTRLCCIVAHVKDQEEIELHRESM